VWAVKYGARHPNVALLDLSSFKCGHDAPTYGIVDGIVTAAQMPYAAQHDIDANKPQGSIKIRVKTYAHSLKMHEEALEDLAAKKAELAHNLAERRLELLRLKEARLHARRQSDPTLSAAIAALAAQINRYQPSERQPEPPRSGLVKLKRKNEEGSLVAIDAAQ
jgi:hypothetical protein